MIDSTLKKQAFKLKGRLYTLTVLSVEDAELDAFTRQIEEVVSKAPKLLKNAPVVLDFSEAEDKDIDLSMFCQILRAHDMIPIGVQGLTAGLSEQADKLQLATFFGSSNHDKPVLEEKTIEQQPESQVNVPLIKSKLITTPIRSGQQVVSRGDLIISSMVSHGAELLADGNIHVYGALRGRALAGINGNKEARIFCQSLEAELVSIAGFYKLSDAIENITGPCQIYLQGEHIQIEPL